MEKKRWGCSKRAFLARSIVAFFLTVLFVQLAASFSSLNQITASSTPTQRQNTILHDNILPGASATPSQPTTDGIENETASFSKTPNTLFTSHVNEVISVIRDVTLPLPINATHPWPFHPHMYCPASYRIYVDTPYSIPSAIECRPVNAWCGFLQCLLQNRTLPFNVSVALSSADRIKLGSMPYGQCLGSSAPKGVFSMNNFQNVKEIMKQVKLQQQGIVSSTTNEIIPWEERNPIPVFRGHARSNSNRKACAGKHVKHGDFGVRPQAVWLSLQSEGFDAALTSGIPKTHPCQAMNASNGLDVVFGYGTTQQQPAQIPSSDYYAKYQVAVVLGGIGAAFRTTSHLQAGQAVILQDFEFEEWFVRFMEPYVHYIPLKRDLSDMDTVLKFVRDHPLQVKQVARNGHLFYKDYLAPLPTMEHWHELLWKVSILQHTHPRWKSAHHRSAWPQPFVPRRFVRNTKYEWVEENRTHTRQPYLDIDQGTEPRTEA